MNKTLLGLLAAVSTMGAPMARADSNYGGPSAPHQPMSQLPHQPMSQPPRQAPRGKNPMGHYEVRPVQTWVPAATQQVWEPGRCAGAFGPRRCLPGHFHTVVTPGHFETQAQWAWVDHDRRSQELADRGPIPGHHAAVPVAPPRHGG